MTKDNFLKFLEGKKIKVNQRDGLVKQARDVGYNAALYDIATHVCIEPQEKLPECCNGKLKGGEDGK